MKNNKLLYERERGRGREREGERERERERGREGEREVNNLAHEYTRGRQLNELIKLGRG